MAWFTTGAAVRTRLPAASLEVPRAMPLVVLTVVVITGPLLSCFMPTSVVGSQGCRLGVRHRTRPRDGAANPLSDFLWTTLGAFAGDEREDRLGVLLDLRPADAVDPQQRLFRGGPGLRDRLQREVGEDDVRRDRVGLRGPAAPLPERLEELLVVRRGAAAAAADAALRARSEGHAAAAAGRRGPGRAAAVPLRARAASGPVLGPFRPE